MYSTLFLFSNSEMPCASLNIVVKLDDDKLPTAIETLKNCLAVSCFGGLQITDCIEMPGSILVKWDEVFYHLVFGVPYHSILIL